MTGWVKNLLLAIFFLATPKVYALISPIGLSFFPPIEFPLPSDTVVGLRYNLFRGSHDNVYGFDIGMFNDTRKNFAGTQFALFTNQNHGNSNVIGLQFALVNNYNRSANVFGLQFAFQNVNSGKDNLMVGLGIGAINSFHGSLIGAQLGLIANYTSNLYGLQIGLSNGTEEIFGRNPKKSTVAGAQLGLFNSADTLYGFQVGLYNRSKILHGVQIGLININDSGPLKFFPLMNAGF